LIPTSLESDTTPTDLILDEVVVLNNNEVVVALNTNEHEPSYEDENDFGIDEDENALINEIIIF
jgi:hypothetical protein